MEKYEVNTDKMHIVAKMFALASIMVIVGLAAITCERKQETQLATEQYKNFVIGKDTVKVNSKGQVIK